jgi:hypothetical protein
MAQRPRLSTNAPTADEVGGVAVLAAPVEAHHRVVGALLLLRQRQKSPRSSASATIPVVSMLLAVCVQPWSTTTSGAPGPALAGR